MTMQDYRTRARPADVTAPTGADACTPVYARRRRKTGVRAWMVMVPVAALSLTGMGVLALTAEPVEPMGGAPYAAEPASAPLIAEPAPDVAAGPLEVAGLETAEAPPAPPAPVSPPAAADARAAAPRPAPQGAPARAPAPAPAPAPAVAAEPAAPTPAEPTGPRPYLESAAPAAAPTPAPAPAPQIVIAPPSA